MSKFLKEFIDAGHEAAGHIQALKDGNHDEGYDPFDYLRALRHTLWEGNKARKELAELEAKLEKARVVLRYYAAYDSGEMAREALKEFGE